MATRPAAAPCPPPRQRPVTDATVAVGVHSGTVSGIDTYVEHLAGAASRIGVSVTLLVTDSRVATDLAARCDRVPVRVVDLGLPVRDKVPVLERLWPGLVARRLRRALQQGLTSRGDHYDVIHLNHPGLASTARPFADLVSVAAWYHPVSMRGRIANTWAHTGRRFPISAVHVIKGISHHRNDMRGYHAADLILAPTDRLRCALAQLGFTAVTSPPPCAAQLDADGTAESVIAADDGDARAIRLLFCSGDLGHPRKNVGAAVETAAVLARRGYHVSLDLIGRNPEAVARHVKRLPAGVTVSMPGLLPSDSVQARMRAADVLLVPSRFEEWGYVAVEAALEGTPAATFPTYPFVETLQAPVGAQATDMTADALADAVETLLRPRGGRAAVAAAAACRYGTDAAAGRLARAWSL